MSDHAAILCDPTGVKAAAEAAYALNEAIRQRGIACDGANEALRALQWRQSAIASEAILKALNFYLERGGGSRGARAVCSPEGGGIPQSRTGPLMDVSFIPERDEDRRADSCSHGWGPLRLRRPADPSPGPGQSPILRAGLARLSDRRDSRSQVTLLAVGQSNERPRIRAQASPWILTAQVIRDMQEDAAVKVDAALRAAIDRS
jgi:hypothetical protein